MSEDELNQRMNETQSLREELIGLRSVEGFGLKKREISVMTRMSVDIVDVLDALVELEIFKSRSEVVAAFVERVITARRPLFDEIRTQANDIIKKRDAAKKLAIQAMRDIQTQEDT
ncbi:MAG: hypothetical protein ACXADL_14795 [Candidatus Thorarchaeota archaeon]|jgi:Arc/MetJ-type ribon-helix-helix transcriptional regulator